MKYFKEEEKEKLEQTNLRLVEFMKSYPKVSLNLTAIGNSISNGFSLSEPGRLLLDRNLGLIQVGKENGLDVHYFHLTRSENNNSYHVANWIRHNCTEQDTYRWNREDYKRLAEEGDTLLTEEEISQYFTGGQNIGIQEVLSNSNSSHANIVILNLGTGSFLDVVTRHGSLTIPSLFGSLNRDLRGISAILEAIQNCNRENGTHTQVYLCGAPRMMNTFLTDLAMNSGIRKISGEYANVTYIPSFPRQAFYKTKNGMVLPDPHYNQAEYYHLLNEIEKGIIQSYSVRELMTDMDNTLFGLSKENDVEETYYNYSDALDIIREYAKKYEAQGGDYNTFIDLARSYLKGRYPYDFYRLAPDDNLGNMARSLRR